MKSILTGLFAWTLLIVLWIYFDPIEVQIGNDTYMTIGVISVVLALGGIAFWFSSIFGLDDENVKKDPFRWFKGTITLGIPTILLMIYLYICFEGINYELEQYGQETKGTVHMNNLYAIGAGEVLYSRAEFTYKGQTYQTIRTKEDKAFPKGTKVKIKFSTRDPRISKILDKIE